MNKRAYKIISIILLGLLVISNIVNYLVSPAIYRNQIATNDELLLDSIYTTIENDYYVEVEKEALVEGAIDGMLRALNDPYTIYYNEEEANQFINNINNTIVGIGVTLGTNSQGVYLADIVEDSPASNAGLVIGDYVISIDGVSVENKAVADIRSMIVGEKDTPVVLEIVRDGKTYSYTIIRKEIELDTIIYHMENDIAYIKITTFSDTVFAEFKQAYVELSKNNPKALIIDVRNNGGGFVQGAFDIADMFCDNTVPIYQTVFRSQEANLFFGDKAKEEIKISLLVNDQTASASEILVGALKEADNASVIGTTTFGKGIMQATINYDKTMLKYTSNEWLTPLGNKVNGVGIIPTTEQYQSDVYYAHRINTDTVYKFDTVDEEIGNVGTILNAFGYNVRTDGYFDQLMLEAVKAYQGANGLEVTGNIDHNTSTKLNEDVLLFIKNTQNDLQLQKAIEVSKNA